LGIWVSPKVAEYIDSKAENGNKKASQARTGTRKSVAPQVPGGRLSFYSPQVPPLLHFHRGVSSLDWSPCFRSTRGDLLLLDFTRDREAGPGAVTPASCWGMHGGSWPQPAGREIFSVVTQPQDQASGHGAPGSTAAALLFPVIQQLRKALCPVPLPLHPYTTIRGRKILCWRACIVRPHHRKAKCLGCGSLVHCMPSMQQGPELDSQHCKKKKKKC
jgi:hypothetical protein